MSDAPIPLINDSQNSKRRYAGFKWVFLGSWYNRCHTTTWVIKLPLEILKVPLEVLSVFLGSQVSKTVFYSL